MKQIAIKKYIGAIVMFAITLYVSAGIMVFLLDWLGLSSGEFWEVAAIASLILASTVFACTCLLWKRSAVVRTAVAKCVNIALFLGCFIGGISLLEWIDSWLLNLAVLFFVGILFIITALPWEKTTNKQCTLLFLKALGAHIPWILSCCLAIVLVLLGEYFSFNNSAGEGIAITALLVTLMTGMGFTLLLLCRVCIALFRYDGIVMALLSLFVGSCFILSLPFVAIMSLPVYVDHTKTLAELGYEVASQSGITGK